MKAHCKMNSVLKGLVHYTGNETCQMKLGLNKIYQLYISATVSYAKFILTWWPCKILTFL